MIDPDGEAPTLPATFEYVKSRGLVGGTWKQASAKANYTQHTDPTSQFVKVSTNSVMGAFGGGFAIGAPSLGRPDTFVIVPGKKE